MRTVPKHTPMLKHTTKGVLRNFPIPGTMCGGKCSNDEKFSCADIGRHDADEHCPKPGHTQYASALPELSHTAPCATPIETASANIRHTVRVEQ